MEKAWSGRFKERTERIVEEFTSSLSFDIELIEEEIQASKAYAKALSGAGVLKEEEANEILRGLDEILSDWKEGKIRLDPSFEDVHMLVESLLREKIGEELGGKLHTGRSRNEQVVTDLRLYLKKRILWELELLKDLRKAIVLKAEDWLGILIPGYTHLRKGQPVLISHWLMAYYEMLKRDEERLRGCLERVDVLPLGSSALGGTPYPLDREFLRRELGFSKISGNSIDAVSDRDFLLEYLGWAVILMIHLSRMAEDLILWSSEEFNFVELPESFCTGSSLMPQKKNPDVLELIRGKVGRVLGGFCALSTTLKGLPLTYNRDLQEDKEVIFDALKTVETSLEVFTPLIEGLRLKESNLKKALQGGFLLATELADYLVQKGLPFREAHRLCGRIVLYCEERGKELWELKLEELKEFSPFIGEDVFRFLDPLEAVKRRNLQGGTSPERVKEAIEKAKRELGFCEDQSSF
jgi:argininosuccinate lyase